MSVCLIHILGCPHKVVMTWLEQEWNILILIKNWSNISGLVSINLLELVSNSQAEKALGNVVGMVVLEEFSSRFGVFFNNQMILSSWDFEERNFGLTEWKAMWAGVCINYKLILVWSLDHLVLFVSWLARIKMMRWF